MGVGWWWRSPLLRLGPKRVRTREVARKGGHGDANEEGAGRFWDGWDGRRGWRGSTGGRAGRSGERSELGTLVLSEGEIKVLGLQFREFHYAWGAVGGWTRFSMERILRSRTWPPGWLVGLGRMPLGIADCRNGLSFRSGSSSPIGWTKQRRRRGYRTVGFPRKRSRWRSGRRSGRVEGRFDQGFEAATLPG